MPLGLIVAIHRRILMAFVCNGQPGSFQIRLIKLYQNIPIGQPPTCRAPLPSGLGEGLPIARLSREQARETPLEERWACGRPSLSGKDALKTRWIHHFLPS